MSELPPVPYQEPMLTKLGLPTNVWSAFFRQLVKSFGGTVISYPITVLNGGTGQTTQQTAIDALTGTQSSGKYLRSNGTHASLSSIVAADVPVLVGASGVSDGTAGAAPAPTAGSQNSFLRGDSTWAVPSGVLSLGALSVAITGTTTLSAVQQCVEAKNASAFTVTLPSAASMLQTSGGSKYGNSVVITNTGTGVVTVAANSGDTIAGSSTAKLQFQWSSFTLYPNNAGTGWLIA